MSIINRLCALAFAAALAASAANADGIINGGSGGGAPTGNAGGDLGGTYPNPTVAKIAGVTPGTGVATALGVNIGSAGGVITFNGPLGTPSSGVATNLTGLPISTGLTGAGTGVLAALGINVGSPSAPVLLNGAGGTPTSLVLTNATGLPVAQVSGSTVATVSSSRDLTTASGTQVVSGFGFTPTSCTGFGGVAGASPNSYTTLNAAVDASFNNTTLGYYAQAVYNSGVFFIAASAVGGGDFQTASVTAFASNQITITWGKTGAPTGTFAFTIRCTR